MIRLAILLLAGALLFTMIGSNETETISGSAEKAARIGTPTEIPGAAHYRIDSGQSRFTVQASSGGLLWFLGHEHLFAIRNFTGEAQLTPKSIVPASLQIRVRADSLEETMESFTPQQKQIINNGARKNVLEADKYPEIIFQSVEVSIEETGESQYKAKIEGDLTLHGVTRRISIPAILSIVGNTLHAQGEFSIDRSDYNVKTTPIKMGTIRIRNKVKFSFDMVARKA